MDIAKHAKEIFESLPFEVIEPKGDEPIGLYRIETNKGCIEFVDLLPHSYYRPHVHNGVDSQLYVLEGRGWIVFDKEQEIYRPGDTFNITRGRFHGFETLERTIFLSVQSSPILDKKTGKFDVRYA